MPPSATSAPARTVSVRPSLILVGAGEHAHVVGESAEMSGWTVLGCVDPQRPARRLPWPWLGDDAALGSLRRKHPQTQLILAFAGAGRAQAAQRILDWEWATVIDPAAVVSPGARIAAGVFVGPLALVHVGARIGAHAIINSGAIVEHDVRIGAFAHVAPGAVLGGGVTVGKSALIGLGASVRDHIRIGASAIVGLGAAVVGNVKAGTTVLGVPARPVKVAPASAGTDGGPRHTECAEYERKHCPSRPAEAGATEGERKVSDVSDVSDIVARVQTPNRKNRKER